VSKNFAGAYNQTSDSSGIIQSFYIKKETTRGTFNPPVGADFLFTMSGGSISASQALNSSQHRSGRHNNNFIKEKRVEEFSLSTYFNIDAAAVDGNTAIDTAMKVLWESALGYTEVGGSDEFIANPSVAPNITFTMIENGDSWGKQLVGGFIESCEIQLPGDGQAMASWSGAGGGVKVVGIGKSVANNSANTVTLAVGEGARFPVGSYVMIIEADGVTRSADTPTGSPRRVVSVAGDVVTLSGAVLSDADGSGVDAPIYLCYYEPTGAAGIDAPETGLVGEISSSLLPAGYCFRSLTIALANNHERVDYCFGADGLDSPFFIPAGRLDVTVTAELNMSKALVGFYNKIVANEPVDIDAILGNATGRHYQFLLPRVIFNIPSIEVPESGSIPVSYEGLSFQSSLDAADEVSVQVN
jgi:hypothetical protein